MTTAIATQGMPPKLEDERTSTQDRGHPAMRIREVLAIEERVIHPQNPVHATEALSELQAQSEPAEPEGGGVGLALSGGGIRSATFGLGVLQALAARNKLGCFDYLSTVSGGGYIGSWLSAWIYRSGLEQVQASLGQFGSVTSKGAPTAKEPAEVTWLRRYSNYLAPRVGILSFDALTLITTWMRNFSLNSIVSLGFLCIVLIVPFLLLQLVRFGESNYVAFGFAAAWLGIVFLGMVGYNLWQQGLRTKRRRNWPISTSGVVATVVTPAVLACWCAAIWVSNSARHLDILTYAFAFVGLLLTVMLLGWGLAELMKPKDDRLKPSEYIIMSFAAAIALAVGSLVLVALSFGRSMLLASSFVNQKEILMLLLGPPALVFAFSIATTVFIGIVGRAYFERSREWWSRLNAWLLSFGVGWALWIGLAFFSLPLLVWVRSQIGGWFALLGTGWIASLLTAILLRKPESTSKRVSMNVDRMLNISATIFVVGLLILTSTFVGALLLELSGVAVKFTPYSAGSPTPAYELKDQRSQLAFIVTALPLDPGRPLPATIQAYLTAFGEIDKYHVLSNSMTAPIAVALGLLLLVGIFGKRVDINKFSLHNMYKNRLVRCYLGASNQNARNEQPFTGLDDLDDLPLSALGGRPDKPGSQTFRAAQRPLHIINAALNLTQGNNLAWQERKAASFIFTPVVCGYSLERTQGDSTSLDNKATGEMPGYRLTTEYGARDHEERGFTLGMALATSGAAVSPNMGHASRPVRAFVLTLFNVRLGRWSANPAGRAWRLPSPRFGLDPLLQELFGYSNERRDFVYLSDGGHFDNLGLYELVRRRCKTIFSIDAGADPTRAMGDLAATIRKCRVDLGVEIEMPDLEALRGDEDGRAQQGFTQAIIRYNLKDPTQNGTLILLKPTLGRDLKEPADVLNYASLNSRFPQQTTADQFFDESQFESYRRLGLCIAEQCLDQHENLLQQPKAGLAPEPAATEQEPPARSTRFVSLLFRKGGNERVSMPSRDGCLVDIFLGLLLLTVCAIGLFWAFDRLVMGIGSAGLCWSQSGCQTALGPLFSVGRSSIAFIVRACADNVFVLLYSAMFASGFVVALRDSKLRKSLLPIACLLLVLTAAVDTAENAWLLSWTEIGSVGPPEAVIASLTMIKSTLVAINVALLLSLSRGIWAAFRSRWLA